MNIIDYLNSLPYVLGGVEETLQMLKWFSGIWFLLYMIIGTYFNETIYWYHVWLYKIAIIKFMGQNQFKRGHRMGAIWGLEEGQKLLGNPKKLKQRKIQRALERAGI